MAKVHIGRKIREVVDKSHFTIVEFAKKINITRDGAYKIFEKDTISTQQLEKIGKVLNYDFFSCYQSHSNTAHENTPKYGYASKQDVEDLTHMIGLLAKEMEKMRKEIAQLPSGKEKKSKRKKNR